MRELMVFVLIAGGCASSGEEVPDVGGACGSCDDMDPCTIDTCEQGQCRHEPMVCNDNNPCTTDSCLKGKCVFEQIAGCCRSDQECDDHDICTVDTCTPAGCRHVQKDKACCKVASDCDDKDVCTIDECVANKCRNTWMKSSLCCKVSADCGDGNPCTDDSCVDGKCVHKNTGCCTTDDDCGDGNPCREWYCDGQTCKYNVKPDCCQVDEDCNDNNPCTTDVCKGGKCDLGKTPGCCTKDADCATGDSCFVGTCKMAEGAAKGECSVALAKGCCKTELLAADFDADGLGGFTVEDLYPDTDGPVWVVDSKRHAPDSPPSSLYFGDPKTHTYEAGTNKVGARAVSPEVDLRFTNGPVLTFELWKQTEMTPSQDVFSVLLQDGQVETVLWSTALFTDYANTNDAFVPVSIALPEASKKVKVVLQFDSISGFANKYEGVYVDALRVKGTCE